MREGRILRNVRKILLQKEKYGKTIEEKEGRGTVGKKVLSAVNKITKLLRGSVSSLRQ